MDWGYRLQTKLSHLGQKWQRSEILPLQDYIAHKLSYLGQKWQQFEIFPLQGYIANRIESFGTKLAAVWNLTLTRLYCRRNWVVGDKNGSSHLAKKDSVLNGHTFKSIYFNVILQSESCKGTFSNLSTTRLFCRQNLEFGTKVGTPSNLSIKRFFAVRIHHLNWKWHTFKSLHYKCAHFCCSFLHLTSIVSWKMMMTWKTCSNGIKIAFWDKLCKSYNLCQWKV